MAKKESIYKTIARDTLINVIPRFVKYNECLGDRQTKIENKVTQYIVSNADEIYSIECGVNPNIVFSFAIEQKYLYELCEEVRKGNIDLEIMLIDHFMERAEFIARKLELDIDVEETLIKAIESYDGSRYISKIL